MRAEQPATTYDSFNRNMICEEARPLNMPYNIAACDSSGYSYSGGQLDHQPYFISVGIEQQECEMDVVEKVFDAWFLLAVVSYGWNVDAYPSPKHSWGWPGKPHNDPVKTATARKISLSTGTTTLGKIFSEDGEDFEDNIEQMASEYGISIKEMKARILEANLGDKTSSVDSDSTRPDRAEEDDVDPTEMAEAAYIERVINGNGRARFTL
jgi:capsid protein